MEKFSTSKDGYNKEEVNKFVNDVVTEVGMKILYGLKNMMKK